MKFNLGLARVEKGRYKEACRLLQEEINFIQGWLFLMHSVILKMTIASVEQRHSTHKSQTDASTKWPYFAARSILAEARQQVLAVERLKHLREAERCQNALDAGLGRPYL